MLTKSNVCVTVVPLIMAVSASAAQAQQAAQQNSQLEEVVVTAEKREAKLQDTPMAIAAFSSQDIINRQITDLQSAADSLPNVTFGEDLGNARVSVRGLSFENISVGGESRIAFHEDGVYIGRPAAQLAGFYDVDRIEVLYGPQGTLYGRNATGGAINVITRDPGDQLNGYLDTTFGNYNLFREEGAIGGPIADGISGRIAFQITDRGGYGEAYPIDVPVDDNHSRALRGKVRFDPLSNLDITVSADYMQERDHNYVFHLISLGGLTPGNPPLTGTLYGGCALYLSQNICTDNDPHDDRKFWGMTGNIHATVDDLELRSITAYRSSNYDLATDIDTTSAPLSAWRQLEDAHQISEELRLSQTHPGYNWTVGGYYYTEDLLGGTLVPIGGGDTFTTTLLGQTPPPLVGLVQGISLLAYQRTDAYAAFANGQYYLTDQLSVRAGGRYSYEKKSDSDYTNYDFVTPFVGIYTTPWGYARTNPTLVQQDSWSSFTPSGTLEYKANNELQFYATGSTGFQSGGYNLGNSQPPYNPEHVTDAEAGMKADWFDHRLRTDLSAFNYWYRDLQVEKIEGVELVIANAASARIYGMEGQFTALPIENVRFFANVGLDHARYTNFTTADSARPSLGVLQLAGNHLNNAPDYTITIAGEYSVATYLGPITFRAEERWVGLVYFSPYNLPSAAAPANHETNLSMRYETINGHWTANLWLKNLENRIYPISAAITIPQWGNNVVGAVSDPRTFGLTVGYKF